MPIYEYELIDGSCEKCGSRFTDLQKLQDPPHTACPDCAMACNRVLSTFSIGKSALLSNERVGKLGFTKYEKRERGVYERTAGSEGPKVIKSSGD